MAIKNVVVAGGGVLGSQIAFQCAYKGYNVTLWAHSEDSKNRTIAKVGELKNTYLKELENMKNGNSWCDGLANKDNFNYEDKVNDVNRAVNAIKYETNIGEAVKDADLLIESIPEVESDKINFNKMVAPLLEEKTIMVTNSSTILPSKLAPSSKRPNKYAALHFANSIWKNNTVEVMVQEKTAKEVGVTLLDFSNNIGMLPLHIQKEKAGYLLNSMLVPFLLSALDLYVNGISTPQMIDDAWTHGTHAPKGPFQIMDSVGMQTVLNIVEQYQKVPGLLSPLLSKMMLPYNFKGMKKVIEQYINEGKMGIQSGEGFYKYNETEREQE